MARWAQLKKPLLVVLVLGLVGLIGLLALMLRGLAEQVLARLILAYQIVAYGVESLPHFLLWALGVLAVLAILLSALIGWSEQSRAALPRVVERPGPLARWAQVAGRALPPSPFRVYERWRLARDLAHLAADVLAHTRRLGRGEATAFLARGDLDLPPAIAAYLRAGLADPPPGRFPRPRSLLGRKDTSPLDLDPGQVVAFLEKEMELR